VRANDRGMGVGKWLRWKRVATIVAGRWSNRLAAVGAVLGWLYCQASAPIFQSEALVFLVPPGADANSESASISVDSLLRSNAAHRFAADQLRLDKKLSLDLNSAAELREFGEGALQIEHPEHRLVLIRTLGHHPAMAKALCAAYLRFLKECVAEFHVRSRVAAGESLEADLNASDKQLTALEGQLLGVDAAQPRTGPQGSSPEPTSSRLEALRLKAEREVLAEQVATLATTQDSIVGSALEAPVNSSVPLRYQAQAQKHRTLLRKRSYRSMSARLQNWDYQLISGPAPVPVQGRWGPVVAGFLLLGGAPILLHLLARRNPALHDLRSFLRNSPTGRGVSVE
jgi:hypothetical protein